MNTARIELTDLVLPLDLGTYGDGDVVPDAHLLDLSLGLSPSRVLIDADDMDLVFDYDPLMQDIDDLARSRHFETQEHLMTLIARACAKYGDISDASICLKKRPVRNGSGVLGVRLFVDAATLNQMRDQAAAAA